MPTGEGLEGVEALIKTPLGANEFVAHDPVSRVPMSRENLLHEDLFVGYTLAESLDAELGGVPRCQQSGHQQGSNTDPVGLLGFMRSFFPAESLSGVWQSVALPTLPPIATQSNWLNGISNPLQQVNEVSLMAFQEPHQSAMGFLRIDDQPPPIETEKHVCTEEWHPLVPVDKRVIH